MRRLLMLTLAFSLWQSGLMRPAIAAEQSETAKCENRDRPRTRYNVHRNMMISVVAGKTYSSIILGETGRPAPAEDECLLETYKVKGKSITSYRRSDVMADRSYRYLYRFEIGTDANRLDVFLVYSPAATRLVGHSDDKEDQEISVRDRLFLIDVWDSDSVTLVESFKGEPSYRVTKRFVKKILRGKVNGLARVSVKKDGNIGITINPFP